jgi:serine/threonine-protein kinase
MFLDFGVVRDATEQRELTKKGVVIGTPRYMSPEQIFQLSRVDARSDLYSVGVVLFECITGRAPFLASTIGEVLQMHAECAAPSIAELVPDASPAIVRIARRALEKSPHDRYPNAEAMLKAVRTARSELERAVPPKAPARNIVEILPAPAAATSAELEVERPAPISQPGAVDTMVEQKRSSYRPLAGAALAAAAVIAIALLARDVRREEPVMAVAPVAILEQGRVDQDPIEPEPIKEQMAAATPIEEVKPAPRASVRRKSRSNRASASHRRMDTVAVQRQLELALLRSPDNAALYKEMGDVYLQVGNRLGALAAYRRYLALDPKGASAKPVRARLVALTKN